MKKQTQLPKRRWLFLSLLSLLMTLTGTGTVWGDELTVYNGTDTNERIPINGYYGDTTPDKGEFIIPATTLSSINGSTITGLKFYANGNTSLTGTFQVFLKEVGSTTLASHSGTEGATTVYTGTLSATSNEMSISFSTDYLYGGGNLLVGIYMTTKGSYASYGYAFYGTNTAENNAYYSNGSSYTGTAQFIPKTTIYYEAPASGPAFKVMDGSTKLSSPYAYNFGLATAGTTKTFTLSNPGTEATPIALSTTGNVGASIGEATSIAAGGEVTLTLTMPDADASGTVTITPTGDGLNPFVFNVSGTKRDPNKVYENDFSSLPDGWTTTGTWYYSAANGAYTQVWYLSSEARLITPKLTIAEGEKFFVEAKGYSTSNTSYQHLQMQYSADGTTWTNFDSEPALDPNNWKTFEFTGAPAGSYYIAINASQADIRMFYGGQLPVEPRNLAISKSGTSATLTWTTNGTETDWQVYTSTTASDIEGEITPTNVSTTPSYTFTGLAVNTTHYAWVRSKLSDTPTYSDWKQISFYLGYTAASPSSCDGSGITNVTFGTGTEVVNNSERPTSSPFYGDYSAKVGGVAAGNTANVAITYTTGYSYGTIIWVDWNQNYEFEESEIVYTGTSAQVSTTTLNASFDISAGQAVGNYRMRIAGADSGFDSYIAGTAEYNTSFPYTGTYKVVHDYTLKVNEASAYSMSISGSDVSENTIAFGTVKNTTTTKTFTITNDGGEDLTNISVVSSDDEVFTVSDTGFDLASGATKDITVTFVKGVVGDYNETITISQADIATPIVLTATATYATPTPATMAATIDDVAVGETVAFGTVNKATTKTFKVTNDGEATLNATIALSGTNAANFTLSTTSLVVAGGSNETFTVTFDSDDEDVAKTATVTLSAAGLSNVAFNVTGTYSDFWTEDFSAGTLPTGWVITPGSYSGDSYAWHIGTYSDYENKTNMAIAPTSSSTYANTIISPRLSAKESDVLTWDAYFNWYDEGMTVEYSNDEKETWTKIYNNYKPEDESISTRYYHKEMSFTAPADGNYYLRFTSHYSNGIDNFAGFKLNPKTHDASITAKSIPATGNQYVDYTATVTVNELLGKDDEVVTAELWIGATKVATEADVTLNASASKVISLTFTPATAMSGDAYIKVYNGDESINLTSDVQAVNIAAALVLDEDVAPGALTSGSKPSMVVNYNAKNGWNTICMPFALTTDILNSLFGTGWKAYEFNSYSAGELGFHNTTTFYGGYPYIIYVETAAVNAEGIKLFNTEIAYTGTTAKADTYGGVSFQGTYAPIAAPDMNGLWGVTSAGKIAKGSNTASLKGFRAYFTGGDLAGAHIAIFDDATGITTVLDAKELFNDGKVYNLNGQRVENAHKGIFIVNGKKVVVK